MASSTSVAPPSSPNALAVRHADGQQLQVIDGKTSRRGGDTTPESINPLLLASVCYGSAGALNFLFNREDAKVAPMIMPTQAFLDLLVGYTPSRSTRRRLTVLHASGGVEDVVDQLDLQAATPLLKGITAEGDTALHVVASHGDNLEFLECARIIVKRYQALLFSLNNKDDTPLHCAARAGHSKMLSCLIEVATSHKRLHELLRQENMCKETALHDAVRIGSNDIVMRLLAADSDLANYPKEGTSPLYLAISLQKDIIARTLHEKSDGNLSYFGPKGGNALHAAILRGTGTKSSILKLISAPD
ncbi:ankyrin-1-like [Triticum aestivum]|uniref:ankyrin-1-like n=1 Tax=Triticum aestivum TaxID=4565 RepID=UPI001D00DC15|nr:ankyrin-1-like [Triticum aestivum]